MSDGSPQVSGEAGRFIAVGGAATVVSAVLFNLLVHGFGDLLDAPMAAHPFAGYVVANSLGMAVSYHGSRHWAFKHRPTRHPDGGVTAYIAINVATMALPIACLWVSRTLLGLADPVSDNVSANVIGLTIGFWTRFYLFRRFVFRHPIHLAEVYDSVA